LKEIYHQLTGDASALSSDNEEDVDVCVCQALDLEDAEVVVDLRHLNTYICRLPYGNDGGLV